MSSREDRPASGNDARVVEEALGEALRDRVEQVPPDVAVRLARIRRDAVAELDARAAQRPGRRWPVLAGGVAGLAAAVALTTSLLLPRAGPVGQPGELLLADADELEAMAEMEVLEDLEFLAWLDQEQLGADQG